MDRPTTIDAYILQCPVEHQERLQQLRQLIHVTAPEAHEKISWQMPTFALHGNLIHFALHKHHIGLYPGADAIAKLQSELTGYQTSKGAVQLPHTKELPTVLIERVVRYCVAKQMETNS